MNEASEIIRQVGAMSYIGIFGVSFLANIVVPVPEEIVILAIGYVAGTDKISFWITLPIVIAGALLSDIGMYYLSLHGNKLVKGAYDKFFAKIVPMSQEFIDAHVSKIVFASRFMVNLRFLGPFFAGQTKMKFKKFLAIDAAALIVYISILMWAGHYFANRIEFIFSGVGQVKNIILIVIGVVLLVSLTQTAKKFFMHWSLKRSAEEKEGFVSNGDTLKK